MPKSKFALITILDGIPGQGNRPDNSLPGGQGGRPDNTLPGQGGSGNRPDQGLPQPPNVIWPPENPPSPDNSLPDNELPPGIPVHLPVFPPNVPDQSLPGSQPKPDQGLPEREQKFELKYSPLYGWVLVPCNSDGGADSGARPDNTLPGQSAQPKRK